MLKTIEMETDLKSAYLQQFVENKKEKKCDFLIC